ncbi:MAG: TonB-dependent receptor [Pseudomonadales bacterium]|nr:TonB-dependent receptor [Pseudomonadales bacterium]
MFLKESTQKIKALLHFFSAFCLCVISVTGHASSPLEEIVVYSSLNKQNASEFIGSLSLIDNDQINAINAQHLDQLLAISPNTNFSGGASRGRFVQIRGIGDLEQFIDPKAYPSVGLTIDGIELNGLFGGGLLFDTQQLEILRGPQGTRLGAAASAGAINIISNTDGNNNYLTTGFGQYNSRQIGLAYGSEVNKSLTARTAIQKYTSDGYITNEFLDRDDTGQFNELQVKTNILWRASEKNQFSLTLLHIDTDNGYDAFSLTNTGYKTQSDQPGYDRQEIHAIGFQNIFQFNESFAIESKFTSLDANLNYGIDEDWTDSNICQNITCAYGSFTGFDLYQRDRKDHSFDSRIIANNLVVGLYLQNQNVDLNRERIGSYPTSINSDYKTQRRAIYGQWEPELTSNIDLLFGARYEKFEDDYDDTNGTNSKSSDDLYSIEAGINFSRNDNDLSILLSRASKPSGVNTDASSNINAVNPIFKDELIDRLRYERETLTNIEIRNRKTIYGGEFQATVFYNERKNPQFETFLYDHITSFAFIGYQDNASESNSLGLELELSKKINERLLIRSSWSFINTEIKNLRVYDFDEYGYINIDSKDQPRAASYQYHIAIDFQVLPMLSAQLQLEGRDDYEYAYYFNRRSENVNLLHASLKSVKDSITLTVWARNLLNKEYPIHGLYFGNDPRDDYTNNLYTQLGEPRNIGLSIRYDL